MKRKVRIREEAREDLRTAKNWYEQRRKGLGRAFGEAFYERVKLIADRPELFAVVRGDIRATTLNQFPYVVFYKADETTVEVLAVLHSSRDPDTWRLRT